MISDFALPRCSIDSISRPASIHAQDMSWFTSSAGSS
jgi:hypothetical protein